MEIAAEDAKARPSTTANRNVVLSHKTTASVRAAFKAHRHTESARVGKIELQYQLAVQENKLLEEKLKRLSSGVDNSSLKGRAQCRNGMGRERTKQKLWKIESRREYGESKKYERLVTDLKQTRSKLKFRSPKYRPGHTNYMPSDPSGVPLTGPRANPGGVVYSNWSRKPRFQNPKVTPGPSDYNPNYENPSEQYVYVDAVVPYGTVDVANEAHHEDTAAVVTLFSHSLSLPPSSPIKSLLNSSKVRSTKSPRLMLEEKKTSAMQAKSTKMKRTARRQMNTIDKYLNGAINESVEYFNRVVNDTVQPVLLPYHITFAELKLLSTELLEEVPDNVTPMGVSGESKETAYICWLIDKLYDALLVGISDMQERETSDAKYPPPSLGDQTPLQHLHGRYVDYNESGRREINTLNAYVETKTPRSKPVAFIPEPFISSPNVPGLADNNFGVELDLPYPKSPEPSTGDRVEVTLDGSSRLCTGTLTTINEADDTCSVLLVTGEHRDNISRSSIHSLEPNIWFPLKYHT